MQGQKAQLKLQTQSTPINLVRKSVEKTTAPKVIFTENVANSNQSSQNIPIHHPHHVSNKLKSSKTFHHPTPKNIKNNNLKSQQTTHDNQGLTQKVYLLEHCLNQYKLQTLSLYSKLTERQKLFQKSKEQMEAEISGYKSLIINLQKELEGQSKLIEESLQKYDIEVNQKEKCIKMINEQSAIIQEINSQMNMLEKTNRNAREVSVNCIKQNEDLKAELCIQKQKYEILLKDYEQLSLNYSKGIRALTDENSKLQRKVEQLDMELKIHIKDKEIEKLLVLQQTIEKRQKSLLKSHENQNSIDSIKEFIPRRLNFEEAPLQTNLKRSQDKQNEKGKISQLKQVIELQKRKIESLQNQLNNIEKRNKQLQQLMVKLMK